MLLLTDEIHRLIGSLSYSLQGLVHVSCINSRRRECCKFNVECEYIYIYIIFFYLCVPASGTFHNLRKIHANSQGSLTFREVRGDIDVLSSFRASVHFFF